MTRSPEDTTRWVTNILNEKKDIVTCAEMTDCQTILITRPNFRPFNAAIISASPLVETAVVDGFTDPMLNISIVANVPKQANWTGDAINRLTQVNIAWGGLGDLYSSIQDADVRAYVRSEFRFFERVIKQHDQVASLERVNEKVYIIHRTRGKRSITVVLINEYELTGDHVRTAREQYGKFDAVLRNNPNGGTTSDARSVARTLGVTIFQIGQLLGRLNAP